MLLGGGSTNLPNRGPLARRVPLPAGRHPFRYTVRELAPGLLEIVYAGYMTADPAHLVATEGLVRASPRPVGLLYIVREFTDFERSQVTQHAAMFSRLGKHATGIAVVGASAVIRFGAISVGLISKTPLKTFETELEARAWLETLRR